MHPLGLYLALDDIHREHDSLTARARPAPLHPVDAVPTSAPRAGSHIARLATVLRRLLLRPAGT